MRRLALLPLLVVTYACTDNALLQPDESMVPEIAVRRDAPKMVPLKCTGPWETDFALVPAGAACAGAGGTHEYYATADLNCTHLGRTSDLIFQCMDLFAFVVIYTEETLTGANGDQLFLLQDEPALAEIPPGWDVGYEFEVVGGTGRFEGASGEGVVYITVGPTATGFGGETMYDGVVSSVGSSK